MGGLELLRALPWRQIIIGAAVAGAAWWGYSHIKGVGYQDGLLHGAADRAELEKELSALRLGMAEEKLSAEREASARFVGQVAQINAEAIRYRDATAKLAAVLRANDKEYKNHAKNNPLSADCKLDPVRVRILADDIRAANIAITTPARPDAGRAVRADPAAGFVEP